MATPPKRRHSKKGHPKEEPRQKGHARKEHVRTDRPQKRHINKSRRPDGEWGELLDGKNSWMERLRGTRFQEYL